MVVRDGFVLVGGEGKEVGEDVHLGKALAVGGIGHFAEAGFEQFTGVFAVQDGEIRLEAEGARVRTEDAIADGVKGAAPEAGEFAAEEVGDAAHHFLGGFIGEGQ